MVRDHTCIMIHREGTVCHAPGWRADPARPITRQITDSIRLQIAGGERPVGSQLPSVRGLAQQLTINPKTVAKVHTELTNEG